MNPLHVLVLATTSAALLAVHQPAAEPAGPAPTAAPALIASYERQLASLRPDNPLGYYLLAEEVADVVDDPERLNLARTLYALAFELDRTRGGNGALAASSALGLAQTASNERDRQWLMALAGGLDPRYLLPDWNVAAWPSISEDVAYKAATVIGHIRAGEGGAARRLMAQPGVTEVLRRYERALGSTGGTGALQRLERYADQWPCRECNNARAISRPGQRGPEIRLCPTCEGNPGPRLSDGELMIYLRFESMLLNGIQRSWGAQVMVDGGSPLRDPDPQELAATLGIDVSRPWWRNGAWSDRP
jgi:hypothetical protein